MEKYSVGLRVQQDIVIDVEEEDMNSAVQTAIDMFNAETWLYTCDEMWSVGRVSFCRNERGGKNV